MRRARWPAFSSALAGAVLLGATVLVNHSSHPAVAGPPGSTATSLPTGTATPTPPGWLERLNLHRAAARLPLIAEVNETWNDGCEKHAMYMVKNHAIGHSENPANEWYSLEGHGCAKSSNVLGSSLPRSDEEAIDGWMEAPFHAVGMLDPHLEESGFGSYREDTNMFPEMSAALDVWRGLAPGMPPSVSFPIMWPGDGQSTPLTRYPGYEGPDPLTSCPDYIAPTGLPLILQLGAGSVNPVVTAHSFMQGVDALGSCVFSETDYSNPIIEHQTLGRLILGGRDAIILIPRDPLILGNQYTASITANGDTHTWTFTVSDVAPPPGTPTITPTPTSTRTPTITPTPTSTRTPTITPTRTSTRTPTATRTATVTRTATATPTATTTPTGNNTSTASPTPTATTTPTFTPTPTWTSTPGETPMFTRTPTATATRSPTLTRTPTPTRTPIIPCGCVGDVNANGSIDSVDAQLILQYVAALIPTLPSLVKGDPNEDGRVDALDALLVLQLEAGFQIPPWFL